MNDDGSDFVCRMAAHLKPIYLIIDRKMQNKFLFREIKPSCNLFSLIEKSPQLKMNHNQKCRISSFGHGAQILKWYSNMFVEINNYIKSA